MHESRHRKYRVELPRAEAFRALAEMTAGAASGVLSIGGHSVLLGDCESLRIRLRHRGDTSVLKLRVSCPSGRPDSGADVSLEAEGKPRYKALKRRMKHVFKRLAGALGAGEPPDSSLIAAFVADSRHMVAYPGRGDPCYPDFSAAVDRLEAAAATGDVAAMTEAVAALDRMKKECHSRHA